MLHLSSPAKETPARHVRYRGWVLAVHAQLCAYDAEGLLYATGLTARNVMEGTHWRGRDETLWGPL